MSWLSGVPSSAQLQEGQGVGRRKRQLQVGEGPFCTPPAPHHTHTCLHPSRSWRRHLGDSAQPLLPPTPPRLQGLKHPVAFSMGLDSPAIRRKGQMDPSSWDSLRPFPQKSWQSRGIGRRGAETADSYLWERVSRKTIPWKYQSGYDNYPGRGRVVFE